MSNLLSWMSNKLFWMTSTSPLLRWVCTIHWLLSIYCRVGTSKWSSSNWTYVMIWDSSSLIWAYIFNVRGAYISCLSRNSSNSLTSCGIWLTLISITDFLYSNIVSFFNLLILNNVLILGSSHWELFKSCHNLILHMSDWNLIILLIFSWFVGCNGNLLSSAEFLSLKYCNRDLFNLGDLFWLHSCHWHHLDVGDSSIFHFSNWNLLSPFVFLILHMGNWDHFSSSLWPCFHLSNRNLNSLWYLFAFHVSYWNLDLFGDRNSFHSNYRFIINSLYWILVMISWLVFSLIHHWSWSLVSNNLTYWSSIMGQWKRSMG